MRINLKKPSCSIYIFFIICISFLVLNCAPTRYDLSKEEIKNEIEELSKIEHVDKSSLIRELLAKGIKEKKIENAVAKYSKGKITLWKAANIADISLWKMIEIIKDKGIEYQYGIDELREDLKALEEKN